MERRACVVLSSSPRPLRKPVDKQLPAVMGLLLLFGLVTLFSATYYKAVQQGSDPFSEVKKQLFGVAVGGVAMFFTSRIPYQFWMERKVAVGGILISAVLLLLVIIPGVGVSINGSRRWLSVGGLSFQPGEFAKYAVVLFMAMTLTARGGRIKKLFSGILPVLAVPGILFLLILEQPNLSTAGTIIIVSILMVMLAGAKWRHMAVLGMGGLIVGAYYAWSAEYRRERLLSFMDPFAKMSDEGYQLSQSLIAFGSGGLFGMGLGQGRQKFAYLPYPESDFIFAIVGEDFGLAGCLAVIALFVAFMLSGMRIALNCEDKFGCLLSAGIIGMISVQAFINMGVVVGVLPTTGLPLPFFSAGGTSLSITMAAVGVVLNISRSGLNNLR
ncbi:MAG: putative lipid II flippase FtsW [Clostridiales bacterium]|nr:putative lipid II flippase FtsW [Clostridiales bacterium]